MRLSILCLSLAFLTLSAARADPLPEDAAALQAVERRSLRLARLVSTQLDRARVEGRRPQARCLDSVLSQVHAVQRHASWQLGRTTVAGGERRMRLARVLAERLEGLRVQQRRCLGAPAAEGTRVRVEIAPWVPR